MHGRNWDNLRFVLSVADHGSISEAARQLGVNHATVLRRVAACEAELGGAIFDRTPSGYRVLPDRLSVIEAAREVANAHLTVERMMHGAGGAVRGTLRISSTDSLCRMILPDFVARMRVQSPDLRVQLLSNNSHLDFSRLQADISVRPAIVLPDDMAGEPVADLAFAAFARDDAPDQWLSLGGPLARSRPASWMAENIASEQIVGGADSFLVLAEMARRGLGISVLPVFVGAVCSDLVRRADAMPELSVPVWVATHVELRDAPRIRVARRELCAHLADQADLLMTGRETP